MDKKHESLSFWTVIGMIAAVAAVVASITTAMIIMRKKEKEVAGRSIHRIRSRDSFPSLILFTTCQLPLSP